MLPSPSIHRSLSPWLTPAVFILLALLLRWGSFFISVINHDESTYIVIADELLRGEVYLRDVIDTKPIGIFWIYAALIKLTGGSIFLLRAAASVFVGLGGWLLSLATRRAGGGAVAGWVAGGVYIFMCSVYTFYGISPNTEIFFNVFTLAAVTLAVAPRTRDRCRDPFWHWPVAGLLLGLGFIIKPFVAAEALATGLFLVHFYFQRGEYRRLFLGGLALVASFSLPQLGVVAYYTYHDLLSALWFYTVEVGGAYPIELPWYLRLKYMGDYLLRYAPFLLLGGVARVRYMRKKSHDFRTWERFLFLLFALVTVVVLLTGKRFGHYQIQLHPVVALWVGLLVGRAWHDWRHWRRVAAGTVVVALGIGVGHALYYARKSDEPRQIAAYLAPRLDPGVTFFAINGFQIAYHLLDRPVPTPYVHSSLLFFDHHVRAFQIDERLAARAIINNPDVRYLVGRVHDPEADTALGRELMEHFRVEGDINNELRVWVRR
ncbi:glycosyltransferase family 39 protein [Lewinella sp. JB7]|uniref:ArnT family glycosyltransferase n=1 Tax=Lewinella sp. JB7 TaxID=2962887 RepID=UPI0020C9F056|nr:glycosyltransferase family 39 protein [Lewinella sp. JB7]MCP9234819.1 glycosyltransferase family 39 protein [Lewinella sp. JB7]